MALSLRARGWPVLCTSRGGVGGLRLDVTDPGSLEQLSYVVNNNTVVLHSIPVRGVIEALRRSSPARVIYLSTTGVYGPASVVDETTPVAPRTERELLRVAEEKDVLGGPWSALVLRPAAIYGPGRVHPPRYYAAKESYRLMGDGGNHVSRIHVDDLARLAEAAMCSELTGAYPVADEEPCNASREIA